MFIDHGAVLTGFTLTNGHTREDGTGIGQGDGGGCRANTSAVLNNRVCPTVNNAVFMVVEHLGVTLFNCALTRNSAVRNGGTSGGTLYNAR